MVRASFYLKVMIGILIGLTVASYGYFRTKDLIAGPQIVIESPANGATLSLPFITISGYVKNIAFLTLNDRQIFVDEKGRIFEQLLLSPGYNIITLKARDRFGRVTKQRLEFVYK